MLLLVRLGQPWVGVEEGYKAFPLPVPLFLREQPDLCGDLTLGAECSGCEKVTPRKPGGGVPGSSGTAVQPQPCLAQIWAVSALPGLNSLET